MKKRFSSGVAEVLKLLECLAAQIAAIHQEEYALGARVLDEPIDGYFEATSMAMCGQRDSARRLFKSAIEGHYCAYAALQADPALVKLRQTPEFHQLLSAAKECQQRFQSGRN